MGTSIHCDQEVGLRSQRWARSCLWRGAGTGPWVLAAMLASTLRRLLPFGAPKNGEDLDGSEQRSTAISKPGRDCRSNALRLRAMEWHDADGVLQRGGGFLGTRLDGHEALLPASR